MDFFYKEDHNIYYDSFLFLCFSFIFNFIYLSSKFKIEKFEEGWPYINSIHPFYVDLMDSVVDVTIFEAWPDTFSTTGIGLATENAFNGLPENGISMIKFE